jgi:ATP-binding cassette, subfamily B, bacterial MsbA
VKYELTTIARLWHYLRRHRFALIVVVALGAISSLAEGFGLAMFAPLVQMVTAGGGTSSGVLTRNIDAIVSSVRVQWRLPILAGLILAFIGFKNCLMMISTALKARIAGAVGQRTRLQIFAQLTDVSYSFWVRNGAGKLLDTLGTEAYRLVEAVSLSLSLLTYVTVVVVLVIVLFLWSWRLSLYVGLGVLVVSLIIRLLTRYAHKIGEENVVRAATLSERIWDAASGMRVIKAFGLEQEYRRRFSLSSDAVRHGSVAVEIAAGSTQPISEFLYAMLLISVLLLSLREGVPLSASVVFLLILSRLQPYLHLIDDSRVRLSAVLPAIENVSRLLDRTDKPYVKSGSIVFDGLHKEIRFLRVSFRYQDCTDDVLRQVSFTIPKGKMTAIVGPSGAGKTTLLHLLARFYDPVEGQILVDGVDLRELRLEDWRGKVAITGQNMHLFRTTVRENIQYGRLNASFDEIVNASRDAEALEFISNLSSGFSTEVGDQGAQLSGGEKQRIALARALLRDPDILLLDEATSELDSVTERAITRVLDQLSKHRTVVVVAHRMSTVMRAEQVIVLRAGCIAEIGTPEELLRNNSIFARMYELQRMGTG